MTYTLYDKLVSNWYKIHSHHTIIFCYLLVLGVWKNSVIILLLIIVTTQFLKFLYNASNDYYTKDIGSLCRPRPQGPLSTREGGKSYLKEMGCL